MGSYWSNAEQRLKPVHKSGCEGKSRAGACLLGLVSVKHHMVFNVLYSTSVYIAYSTEILI